MNIFDLVKTLAPEHTVIITDTQGEDTGERFTLHSPTSGVMVKAFEAYLLATNKLQRDNKPLLDKCEESGDYTDYNAIARGVIDALDRALAITCVAGWTLDDPATEENIGNLLDQLPYLVGLIGNAAWAAKIAESKK